MNTCVVINSCDKYEFILDEFFSHLEANFPYQYFDIYHITENSSYSKPYTHTIITNESCWKRRFMAGLGEIKSDNFIYLQEDFLVLNSQHDVIVNAINMHESISELVITKLGTNSEFQVDFTGYCLNNHPIFCQFTGDYLMSHQPVAIFDKEFFIDTLKDIDNPWSHECDISKKIDNLDYGIKEIWCIGQIYKPNRSDIIRIHHAIRKGIYVPYDNKTQ